jgi:hypothetical protein
MGGCVSLGFYGRVAHGRRLKSCRSCRAHGVKVVMRLERVRCLCSLLRLATNKEIPTIAPWYMEVPRARLGVLVAPPY